MRHRLTFCRTATFAVGVWAGSIVSTPAQLHAPKPEPIAGARMPALSPDGKRLAFVYRGDIWIGSSKGGRATPVTQHVESDASPVFAPDGQWIAFTSRRTGNGDIFAVPADGGVPRRLTWHGGGDVPQGWSPDGKSLLFAGRRDSVNYAIFKVDVESLQTERLCEDYAPLYSPAFSPDGRWVAYGRYGFHWTRPRYTGSAAQEIWLCDTSDPAHPRHALTDSGHQHLWTRFMPDGRHLLTVTVGEATPSFSKLDEIIPPVQDTPARTPNLWLFDLEGAGRPLTTFIGGGVRCPSVAGTTGDIAFEYGQDLWLLRSGRKKPEKIEMLVAADEKQTTRRREKLSSGVTEAEPSPDGKTFAFGLRGDIWTVPIDKGKGGASKGAEFARRLTEWVGDDSDFSWSPKGRTLYFTSDREFNTRLYELDLEKLEVTSLWERTEDITGPRVSPDGKQIGLWVAGREGGLYVLDLKTRAPRRVVRLPGPQWRGAGGGDFAWSPDMKWIAYSHRGASGAYNLWIVAAAGGEPVNVTRLFAQHSQPAWSPDGKFLFFQSNRDGEGLYALALTREVGRAANGEVKFEKPTNSVAVTIEFDDLSRRIRKLTTQNPGSDLTVTSEGLILFLSDSDVWSVTYDGKETKRLTTGGGKQSLRVSNDGRRAFFVQGSAPGADLYTMSLDGKIPEKVSFTAEWERDVRAERQAAFTQFWRSYHRAFYDANFHGRDWNAIRERYEPMLEAVETNEEFASLLQMMIGELETSHAEVTPAGGGGASPVTPLLGFTFDYSHPGPGLKVAEVPEGAPGWFRKTQIKEGEYVLAINGRDVRLNERLYEWINDKQDREFEFLVSTNTEKKFARTVKYKPLAAEDWTQLNYRNRTAGLRRRVEEESRNRIGYLHIPAMMPKDQVQFEKEAYEYVVDKEAMIIDVRFNSGGHIADTLIDWLERKPFGYIRVRDADKVPSPQQSWDKPIVVLMNEHSYSNGEIFPYAMRARGLAKLVGMPTPGYVIWTYALKLVDGTGARMPESGFYRLDGTPQENNGERPDIQVPLSPDDWVAGRDPQLEKAIELLIAPPAVTPAASKEESVEP